MNFGDILQDPELATEFILTRSQETVNDKGRAEFTNTDTPVTGVILPATAKQIERLPEERRSSETLAVYSPKLLTEGGETLAADVIAWGGDTYEVQSVKDYMQLAGFCEALIQSTSVVGRDVEENG